MNLDIKHESTGDNDSVEEALIAILNIKTANNTFISHQDLFDEVYLAYKTDRTAFGIELYEEKLK
jgi:hypothetical protein